MNIEQTSQITVKTREHTIRSGVIATHKVVGDIYGVQIETTETHQVGSNKPTVKTSHRVGLADTKGVRAVREGKALPDCPLVEHLGSDGKGGILAVRSTFVDAFAKHGDFYRDEKHKEHNTYKDHKVNDPLAAAEAGEDLLLVEAYSYAGNCFDMDGVPYSRPLMFNYIDGGFDNESYDLKRAVEILLQDPRVELLPDGGERSWSYSKDDKVEYVGQIPGYNAEKGRTRCIAFLLRLPRDEYIAVYKGKGEGEGHRSMRDYIINSDLLGLIAGGASKYMMVNGKYDSKGTSYNPLYKGAGKAGPHPEGCRCAKCDPDEDDDSYGDDDD
jgi:hypothetical protein